MTDKGNSWFIWANQTIRENEALVVNLLSAIAPWGAPLIPANLTFRHMTNTLGFDTLITYIAAFVIEVLGLSAVSTILAFWAYNRKRMAEHKKAPVNVAVGSFIAYLLIILSVNVALDAAKIFENPALLSWTIVGANAMLSLLSVPAAVIMAVRVQHKEMLDAMADATTPEVSTRKPPKEQPAQQVSYALEAVTSDQEPATRKGKFLADVHSGRIASLLVDGDGQPVAMTPENIAVLYDTSVRNAYRWLNEIKQ